MPERSAAPVRRAAEICRQNALNLPMVYAGRAEAARAATRSARLATAKKCPTADLGGRAKSSGGDAVILQDSIGRGH